MVGCAKLSATVCSGRAPFWLATSISAGDFVACCSSSVGGSLFLCVARCKSLVRGPRLLVRSLLGYAESCFFFFDLLHGLIAAARQVSPLQMHPERHNG